MEEMGAFEASQLVPYLEFRDADRTQGALRLVFDEPVHAKLIKISPLVAKVANFGVIVEVVKVLLQLGVVDIVLL